VPGCCVSPLCRDDLIFLIYLYQRWVYRVDMSRVNEFGFSGQQADEREAAAAAGAEGSTEPAALEVSRRHCCRLLLCVCFECAPCDSKLGLSGSRGYHLTIDTMLPDTNNTWVGVGGGGRGRGRGVRGRVQAGVPGCRGGGVQGGRVAPTQQHT
jgi:hypothetical protein